MAFMDTSRLQDGEGLAEVVARHPNVERVLAGHLHRIVTAPFAGTLLSVAPSTYRQLNLSLHPDSPLSVAADPTGFLLHVSAGVTTDPWITHAVQVSHAGVVTGAM
jgi:3',5'-cyclic AMP phosphodiesterase CpdA